MSSSPTNAAPSNGSVARGGSAAGRETVSWREKLAYGIGGIPVQFSEAGLKSLAVPVYQMTLRIDPALLGLMLALPRLIDAATDPLMGHISDRTRSRFGRRRPYIVVGGLLTGVSFALIWMVPTGWAQSSQLAWFGATSILFYLCNTVWAVPYQSLGFEITPDYNERTRVMGVQTIFIKVASFSYQWVFPIAQLAFFASVMQGVQAVTMAVALLVFVVAGCLPGLFVRERFSHAAEASTTKPSFRFWESCRAVLQNRGMLILAAVAILQTIAGMLSGSLDYYLIVYHMCGGDLVQGSIWKGVLSSAYAVVGLVSIWPAVWLSQRFDKRTALSIIYGMLAVGGLMKWFIFNPNYPWLIILDPILCAPVYVGLTVLVPSITADVCDEDELKSGERREGLFGAMLSWIRKTGLSLAFLGSGLTLNLIGFDSARQGSQDPDTILSLRLVMTLAPTLTALVTLGLLRFFHLNRAEAAAVRAQLEARRGVVR